MSSHGKLKAMTQRPSFEQLRVLTLLRLNPEGKLVYYKGGFWGEPGQKLSSSGAPVHWWTGTQTVRGMQNKGWLIENPGTGYNGYPTLCERQLTPAGRAASEKYTVESDKLKPVVTRT
jgi:hypothetical protein